MSEQQQNLVHPQNKLINSTTFDDQIRLENHIKPSKLTSKNHKVAAIADRCATTSTPKNYKRNPLNTSPQTEHLPFATDQETLIFTVLKLRTSAHYNIISSFIIHLILFYYLFIFKCIVYFIAKIKPLSTRIRAFYHSIMFLSSKKLSKTNASQASSLALS